MTKNDSLHSYRFLKSAGRILNSGQSRSLVITGNIHDLFLLSGDEGTNYVPLVNFISSKWNVSDRILLVYELNGPIRFVKSEDREKVRDAWLKWRTGMDSNTIAVENMLSHGKQQAELETLSKTFDANLSAAVGNPTVALELLRQICICSRTSLDGKPILDESLIIIIEAADMVIPEGEINRMSDTDRYRISICQDWFSDPDFMNGDDSVVLLSESRSLINNRIARLPQMIEVEISSPDESTRKCFIEWFDEQQPDNRKLKLNGSMEELVRLTAGLSIHALMQMLKGVCHEKRELSSNDVVVKVEEYIKSQLGEDIVEFKKPQHTFKDVVGFTNLKKFLKNEVIPRFRASGPETLPGAAVCGPIGGGKTFIFEAVASELDMVVLVLKNIRSQWYGQTDVTFERLRRVLNALAKVLIFVDEADTQFGAVGPQAHATERRLTGKIQAMMSDTSLRGKVIWLLMTARIQLLSPDIRRPGRVGDLIIPVLDPEGGDKEEFLKWIVKPVLGRELTKKEMNELGEEIGVCSAASCASLRSELKAKSIMNKKGGKLEFEEIIEVVKDHIPPNIDKTRRYQTLQALINCTRKSLLPDPDVSEKDRKSWITELKLLETEI